MFAGGCVTSYVQGNAVTKRVLLALTPCLTTDGQVCKLFQSARLSEAGTYRLHVLNTKLVRLASDIQNWRQERLTDPEDSPLWFGILLREDMPNVSVTCLSCAGFTVSSCEFKCNWCGTDSPVPIVHTFW